MAKVVNIGAENSLFNQFIKEIRDRDIQQDRMRFRRNLERIGEISAYELSKELNYIDETVTTPLGEAPMKVIENQLVIATILRAGLPLHQGLLNYFDHADNAFLSAYRLHTTENDFEIKVDYVSCPALEGRVLILNDPMLATGSSMIACYKALLDQYGEPAYTHIVSAIGSLDGVEYVQKNLPDNSTIWIGAVDVELTAQSYIVPGLGDAGDLAFGIKE